MRPFLPLRTKPLRPPAASACAEVPQPALRVPSRSAVPALPSPLPAPTRSLAFATPNSKRNQDTGKECRRNRFAATPVSSYLDLKVLPGIAAWSFLRVSPANGPHRLASRCVHRNNPAARDDQAISAVNSVKEVFRCKAVGSQSQQLQNGATSITPRLRAQRKLLRQERNRLHASGYPRTGLLI
jgi:hypothetical protein